MSSGTVFFHSVSWAVFFFFVGGGRSKRVLRGGGRGLTIFPVHTVKRGPKNPINTTHTVYCRGGCMVYGWPTDSFFHWVREAVFFFRGVGGSKRALRGGASGGDNFLQISDSY